MIWEIGDAPKEIEGLDEQGRPDPAYAAALGLIPAPAGRRVLSTVIELCILLLLTLPGVLIATPVLVRIGSGSADAGTMLARGELMLPIIMVIVSNVLVTVFTVVQLILHGRIGVTVGKALTGLRSVNVRTLEKPGFWRGAVVRYLLLAASFLVPLFGPLLVVALSPLFDAQRRGRGWLDQASAMWMVDSRRGLNPYDVKRMRIARKSLDTPEHEERAPLPSLATPLERNAPASYTPSARFSGGVIGAHRASTTAQRKPEAEPAAPAVSDAGAGTPGASPFAPPAAPMNAVPPVLPQISLLGEPPAAPVPAPAAPVAQPAPAPVAPAAHVPAAAGPVAPAVPAPVAPAPVVPAAPASAPAPASPAAPASAPGVRATVVIDDGRRIEVRGATLFGRAPAPLAGEGAVQLVPVPDDTRSVSKTHLALLPARRGVVAVDRGSTNGSSVTRDGVETALTPGEPMALQAGDVVRFGDRTMTVERA